jgi:flagellar basal body rod protein FlgC
MAISLFTALSGLLHQSRRLEVSAHNVANIATDGFQASRAVGEERATGGVATRIVPTQDSPPLLLADGELLTGSNTDPLAEVVTQISARAAYGANLAALEASLEAEQALLDILA